MSRPVLLDLFCCAGGAFERLTKPLQVGFDFEATS